MELWTKNMGQDILVKVRVSPGSSRNLITGITGDSLAVKLQAPPVEGKANSSLRYFLSDVFELKKNRVRLETGEKSRDKIVRFLNYTQEELQKKLSSLGIPHLP